jgi:hypothetical protein
MAVLRAEIKTRYIQNTQQERIQDLQQPLKMIHTSVLLLEDWMQFYPICLPRSCSYDVNNNLLMTDNVCTKLKLLSFITQLILRPSYDKFTKKLGTSYTISFNGVPQIISYHETRHIAVQDTLAFTIRTHRAEQMDSSAPSRRVKNRGRKIGKC